MRVRDRLPAVARHPEQGWSSLLFLLGMLALVGASFANARPLALVPGGASLTATLPLLLVVGGLLGFLLARSGIGVVRAHILGATAAALLLLWSAGGVALETFPGSAPEAAFSERIGAVWVLLERDVQTTGANFQTTAAGGDPTPLLNYLLLASILWTTAHFGAFSIFRYDRGGPAVAASGTVLFLNIGLGSSVPAEELLPVLPVLALFSTLAMALLIRLQLVQQRTGWARRHISDTGEVSRLFLRSGALFVALTVISASSLTAVATIEPVTMRLEQLEEPIEGLGDQIAKWLGLVGVPPPEAAPPVRGDETEIWSSWTPGEGIAFTATSTASTRGNYWWGWADDHYDVERGKWKRQGAVELTVDPGEQLPFPIADGLQHETVVEMVLGDATPATARAQLFRLAEAATVQEESVTALVVDDGRHASDILWNDPLDVGEGVTVTSYVHDYRSDGEGVTAGHLRSAGDDYPDWLEQKYLQGAGDERINGPGVQALVKEIEERADDNAYDQALALQNELRGYAYVPEVDCAAYGSIPECVMAEQRGFCTHYATTMTMALREMGIPSRFVTGYLPGELDQAGVTWVVEQAALHNWVEVYFPGYGWIRFDPTPGRAYNQAATNLPDPGDAGPITPPGPDPSPEASSLLPPTPGPSDGAVVPPFAFDDGRTDTVFLVLSLGGIVALLLTVVGVLLLFRLRRLPEGDDGLAYRGIVSLATRLGYGPHPSQTEYEYAGTLSDAIPGAREDLYLVAEARVETAYGQRHLDRERKGLLRGAYSRIRTALLRLSLRRG